jgi:hypothetical protein
MALQKATVVNAGMYTNPNTFTRSLASSYQNMASQINVLADIFTFGERSPVADGVDARWEWSTAINSETSAGMANPVSMGLDGTSIFTYAGSDYGNISYLFKVTNSLDEDRPSTIYETFVNYKTYIDTAIAERTNALTTIVANTTTDLSGVENGTLLVCESEQISISNWSIVDDNLIGAGVINIVPDNALYANDQYIVIEPTGPNHIHIRPGGTIDASTANLILGGELTNVTVSDNEGQHVKIYSRNEDNDGSHVWAFSEDGTTAFPVLTVDLHNGGGAAEVLQFSGASTQCVITGPTPGIDVDAQRIIVQGQKATGTGEGGDVYVWGGDAEKAGGNIQIYAGDADSLVSSDASGGYVNIGGGLGLDYGGQVNIAGGASTGEGGHVTISGGSGDSNPGEVIITSNSNTWTFNNAGYMTVPGEKDLLDAVDGSSLTGGGNRVVTITSQVEPNYAMDGTANIVLAEYDGNQEFEITLPASSEAYIKVGYEITIADKNGEAATNNITILAAAGDSIIGASSGVAIDTNFGLLNLKYVGSGLWLMMFGR